MQNKQKKAMVLALACMMMSGAVPVWADSGSAIVLMAASEEGDVATLTENIKQVISGIDPSKNLSNSGFTETELDTTTFRAGDVVAIAKDRYIFVAGDQWLQWTGVDTVNECAAPSSFAQARYFRYNKKRPELTIPSDCTGQVGQTLKDVTLEKHFAWENTEAALETPGVQEYAALYTPDNTVMYYAAQVHIPVTVTAEAETAPEGYTLPPSKVTLTYDSSLSAENVSALLGDDWKVTGSLNAKAGEQQVTATYVGTVTPAPADVQVTVDILKKKLSFGEYYLVVPYGTTPTDDLLPDVDGGELKWENAKEVTKETKLTCSFIPDDKENYETVTGIRAVVSPTASKKAQEEPASEMTLTYKSGLSLADIELPEGWSFDDTSKSLSAGTYKETAFTTLPADSEYFEDGDEDNGQVVKKEITITVKKASPTVATSYAITVPTGTSLTNDLLPKVDGGVLAFKSDETVTEPGTVTKKASFTPDDTANYEAVDNIDIQVTVYKAKESVTRPSQTSYTYTYGDISSASDIELPEGWSFSNPKEKMTAGTHSLTAVYAKQPGVEYTEAADDMTITVVVEKKAVSLPEISLSVKKGETLTDDLLPDVEEGTLTWAKSYKVKASGTYYAKFTPTDTKNYKSNSKVPAEVTIKAEEKDDSSSEDSSTSDNTTTDTSTSSSSSTNNGGSSSNSGNYGTVDDGNSNKGKTYVDTTAKDSDDEKEEETQSTRKTPSRSIVLTSNRTKNARLLTNNNTTTTNETETAAQTTQNKKVSDVKTKTPEASNENETDANGRKINTGSSNDGENRNANQGRVGRSLWNVDNAAPEESSENAVEASNDDDGMIATLPSDITTGQVAETTAAVEPEPAQEKQGPNKFVIGGIIAAIAAAAGGGFYFFKKKKEEEN